MVERPGKGDAICEGGLEKLETCSIGADLPHCSKVKLEMTDGFSIGADIGFLAEHDLIDQLRGLTVSRRLHRTSIQVRSRCNRLRSDMQSQTAKTCASIKIRKDWISRIAVNTGCSIMRCPQGQYRQRAPKLFRSLG